MNPTDAQRICIEETYGMPSAIAAGAGSGKTATLTERVVFALMHPDISGVTDISQILAITYTNKAAAEMRSRFKEALRAAGLLDQALKVDGAWVCTIHGMCGRILRENAFVLGVDPRYQVLPDDRGAAMRLEAFEQALHAYGSSDPVKTAALADLFDSFTREQVIAMIDAIASCGEGAVVTGELGNPVDHILRLVAYTQELAAECRSISNKSAQTYYGDALVALADFFAMPVSDEVLTATPSSELIAQLSSLSPAGLLAVVDCFPVIPARGALVNLFPGGGDLSAQTALFWCAYNVHLALAGRHLGVLCELAYDAKKRFDAAKQIEGYLDNDDMIGLAAAALRDPANANLLEHYRNLFKLVMVDEFQDTNAAQVQMINLVAGGSDDRLSEKLCVVGDAQQSIYRFRDADLAVFQKHVARVREAQENGAGKLVSLGENFRSHAQILAFSKGVFSEVFGADSYLELLHARNEDDIAPEKQFKGIDGTVEDASGVSAAISEGEEEPLADIPHRINVNIFSLGGNASISSLAAKAIAKDFKALIDCGHRPGEMAILLGVMGNAGEYARALQELEIPCAITGGSVFKDDVDAHMVIKLCFALANPYDTEQLAAILAGDLFGLDPDDFMQLVPSLPETWRDDPASLADALAECLDNRATEEEIRSGDYSLRLGNALAVLANAVRNVGTQPLSDVVESVLANSGWLSRLGGDATVRAGNAFKAVRMLRALEKETAADALELARMLERRITSLKESPGVLSAKGADFVRIMTIHASKGLQFPIVAVSDADFAKRGANAFKRTTLDGKTYIALDPSVPSEGRVKNGLVQKCQKTFFEKFKAMHTPQEMSGILQHRSDIASYCAALKVVDMQGEAEEHQRKLYVAYTRAKDCLIVCMKAPSNNDGMETAQAIVQLLSGGGESLELAKESTYGRVIAQVKTRYEGHPEQDIVWKARVQLFGKGYDASVGEPEEPQASDALPIDDADVLSERQEFAVPTQLVPLSTADVPLRMQWTEGIVSASALKHEAAEDDVDAEQPAPPMLITNDPEDDDEFSDAWLGAEEGAAATERGTAFHALGEWAAAAWRPGEALTMPPEDRIAAIARMYGLNAAQVQRLHEQLDCWFASDAAAFTAKHAYVAPEVPFFVQVKEAASTAENPLVLQGFIDLLAYDEMGVGSAYVVDYKTGFFLQTDEQRRAAYGMQAKCYAYALMLQGFTDVQLDFVFVDQGASATHFPAPDEEPWTLESLRADIAAVLEH